MASVSAADVSSLSKFLKYEWVWTQQHPKLYFMAQFFTKSIYCFYISHD